MMKKLLVAVKARTILADDYGWKDHASKFNHRLKGSSKRRLDTMDHLKEKHSAHCTAPPLQNPAAADAGIALPAPPPEVREMNRILSSVPVDLKQLGELAEGHPQLTHRVLWLCHSSLFNLPEPVSRLEHGVILAGADNIRTLLLADAIMDYSARLLTPSISQRFWWHSLLVAQLSERLALWTGDQQVEQAYLAGLLHDLGTLPMLAWAERQGCRSQAPLQWIADAPETQRQRFGTDHCELGKQIGVEWNFPLPLVEVFAAHHEPGDGSAAFPIAHLVAVAEQVCQCCGAGFDSESAPEPGSMPEPSSMQRLIRQILMDYFPDLGFSDSLHFAQALESDITQTGQKLKEKVLAGPAV
ncbi:MAG: HDOD domain-containing protein [Terriglobia bacterium]